MSDGQTQKEPTMEEILASIRRIIAEDGGDDAIKPDASPDTRVEIRTRETTLVARDMPVGDNDSGDIDSGDDALELVDVIEDEPAAPRASRAVASEQDDEEDEVGWDATGDLPVGDDDAAPVAASTEEDVMELSDVIEESEPQSTYAPTHYAQDNTPAERETPRWTDSFTPRQVPVEKPQEQYQPRARQSYSEDLPPSQSSYAMEDRAPASPASRSYNEPVSSARHSAGLISEQTEQAAMAAFGLLSNTLVSHPGGDGKTIEDLVKEMLEPLLRQWLDANLPGIVERLVQEEIERVARRSGR